MKSGTLLMSIAALLGTTTYANQAHQTPTSFSAYQKLTEWFTTPHVYHPNVKDAQAFLQYDQTQIGAQHIVNVRESLYHALSGLSKTWTSLASEIESPPQHMLNADADTYPYWRMVPLYLSSIIPSSSDAQWESACYKSNSGSIMANGDNTYTITVTSKHAKESLCTDSYLFGTVDGVMLQSVTCLWAPLCDTTSTYKWTMSDNATEADVFDLHSLGVRVFRFLDDTKTTISDLSKTVSLFHPLTTQGVSEEDAQVNIDFLAKYANFKVFQRSVQEVPLNESLINDGDFFSVLRLDGLDPMLAWAMGAHSGHTVMALRIGGQLYIVESTNKNSYWPTNGVQRTPYQTWIKQARAAGYNLLWAPLTPAAAKSFNSTAALEYFQTVEGFDYGYQTLLWGWQDTQLDNYPCLPPDFTSLCLTPHHVQVLFGFIDKSLPSVGDVLFSQAWAKRIGRDEKLSFAEILMYGNRSGHAAIDIPVIPEQDNWMYNTTRYGVVAEGPALVCCTFVCNMWKHAGVFGELADQIQCAEQTNLDDYTLNILSIPTTRPAACEAADPHNVLCQLEGEYSVDLGDVYATRTPYSHMDEHCPGRAPDYTRPGNC